MHHLHDNHLHLIAMKKKILYIVTSKTNMGDLALCLSWIRDLGRKNYSYSFVLDPDLVPYISSLDSYLTFDKDRDIRKTILEAVDQFAAEAIIFATNSFWNLPGHNSCQFGKFVLNKEDVSIPVFSFDPFESGFNHIMPQSGHIIPFSAVPDWVYALRYMSIPPLTANARHFFAESVYNKSTLIDPARVISKWEGKTDMKTIFYPLSKDRFYFIQQHYPNYFGYLGEIFSELAADRIQVLTILPEKIPEFEALENVIILPPIPYEDFLSLINASDLYLTDSFISCIVESIQLETPAMLLMNSGKNNALLSGSFFKGGAFPFWVWPYGMYQVCIAFEELFELGHCYGKAEILDKAEVLSSIRKMLFSEQKRAEVIDNCRQWKSERKKNLPTPAMVLDDVFSQHVPGK